MSHCALRSGHRQVCGQGSGGGAGGGAQSGASVNAAGRVARAAERRHPGCGHRGVTSHGGAGEGFLGARRTLFCPGDVAGDGYSRWTVPTHVAWLAPAKGLAQDEQQSRLLLTQAQERQQRSTASKPTGSRLKPRRPLLPLSQQANSPGGGNTPGSLGTNKTTPLKFRTRRGAARARCNAEDVHFFCVANVILFSCSWRWHRLSGEI